VIKEFRQVYAYLYKNNEFTNIFLREG